MYKTPDEARVFCERFREIYKDTDVQALICAPAVDLSACSDALKGTDIMLGAQNVYFEKEGAYTGETSIDMIKALGCGFSIVGHSERRQYFGETDETVNLKAKALLASGLRPIICVGEAEEIRVAGTQNEFVKKQLIGAFEGITSEDAVRCVIAYEPIWAIGTGRVATPEQAGDMCAFIRETLIELYDEDTADEIIIQYGGSVKPENISDIMDMPEIDGALVGGASLDPEKFMAIIDF
jgi:triosephosphate isomerase